MTGLEQLRSIIHEITHGSACTNLCKINGFVLNLDGYGCKEGIGCADCEELALRKVADEIERDLNALKRSKDVCFDCANELDMMADAVGVNVIDDKLVQSKRTFKAIDRMKSRLMPEGMEWPTVDGKPVDFVTGYEPSLGVLEAVSIYSNGACEVMGHDGIIKNVTEIHIAAPKVLDADGVEIRVGDTVCGTRDMEPMRVVDTDSRECGFKHIKCEKEGDGFFFYWADELTHKLPVLAVDGKPLREGETVWDTLGNRRFKVLGFASDAKLGEFTVKTAGIDGMSLEGYSKPSDLTHERPVADTWERLEEDATRPPRDYCGMLLNWAIDPGQDDAHYIEGMAEDLVRRAKKLAGVS